MTRIKNVLLLSASLVLVTSIFGSAVAEPVKIRIGWSVAPAHLAPLLTEKPDLMKNNGKSYQVVPTRFRGSGPMITALAANEVDIAGMSYQALALSIINANLDVRVIADVLSNAVDGHADVEYWVRKGEVSSVKALKGKRLGVNARGSGIDAGVRKMMKDQGFEDKRDYSIVEMRFPAQLPALEGKKIDLAALLPPFNLIAQRKGKFEKLFLLSDAIGPTQTVIWAARQGWLDKNRAAIQDFMTDYVRTARWFMDPANRSAAADIIGKVTKRPAKLYASWVFTKADWYRHPDAAPDIALLQKNIDDFASFGLIPKTVKLAPEYVDLSFQKNAVNALK